MKILWLSHLVPYPPKGGVLQRSYHLLKQLATHHEVDLLAFVQEPLLKPAFSSIDAGLREAEEHFRGYLGRVAFFPIPIQSIPYGKHLMALLCLFKTKPYSIAWLESQAFAEKVREWTREKKYDLIHFDTISLMLYADDVSQCSAFALDHHNVESHLLVRRASLETSKLKKFYYWQEGKKLERWEKKYCPKVGLNIMCSDLDGKRLEEIAGGGKFKTIPNGVDIEYFTPTFEAREDRLIFVGRLNWDPNRRATLTLAKEIWPTLRDKFPNLHMDIVGANPDPYLLELAAKDERFHVHGFVDDVRVYIKRAKVFLCPIDDGGGTKLKILDAMAQGIPIIAHPVACEGINVKDGKHLVFAITAEEYVDKLNLLLSNNELCEKLAKAGRQLIEDEYAYGSIGKELALSYESVVTR